MQDITKIVQKTFEDIKIEDETWFEFWSARELMNSLWYKKWQKFEWVLEKSQLSCNNSGNIAEKHFLQEGVKTSKVWWRPKKNWKERN